MIKYLTQFGQSTFWKVRDCVCKNAGTSVFLDQKGKFIVRFARVLYEKETVFVQYQ